MAQEGDGVMVIRFLAFVRSWWKFLLRGALLALPTLALLPLGFVWLVERGVVLEWLVAWAVGALLALGAGSLWRPALSPFQLNEAAPGAPPAEIEARARIKKIADAVTADDISNAENAQSLLRRIFEQVASAYRPEKKTPVLEVTIPELLRVMELTSRGLHEKLVTTFPLASHIPLSTSQAAAALKVWIDRLMPMYREGRLVVNRGGLGNSDSPIGGFPA
jgi:hypothetical protein